MYLELTMQKCNLKRLSKKNPPKYREKVLSNIPKEKLNCYSTGLWNSLHQIEKPITGRKLLEISGSVKYLEFG